MEAIADAFEQARAIFEKTDDDYCSHNSGKGVKEFENNSNGTANHQ